MRALIVALALLTPQLALASDHTVQASAAWSRATPPAAQNAAGYLTLTSGIDDRLIAVETTSAARTEIHEMSMKGGVMSMKALPEGLALPKGEQVTLAPGGVHLMFLGLKEPLVAGAKVIVTLKFQHAPPMKLELDVQPIGSKGPGR